MLGGCGVLDRGFLSPAGPVAQVIHDEFLFVCFVKLFVIVPVLLLVPLVAWHYRLSNTKSVYRPQWGSSWGLEGLIWVPPTTIVVILAAFLWRDTHRLDPHKPLPGEAVTVQAIAADWKWIFVYPEQGVATVNRLVIPAGRPVHLDLTSATVMQAILMPRLAPHLRPAVLWLGLTWVLGSAFLGMEVNDFATMARDGATADRSFCLPSRCWSARTGCTCSPASSGFRSCCSSSPVAGSTGP